MQIKTSQRLHWVDQWRGAAVFLMIIYHLAFDLNFLSILSIDQSVLFWFIEGNVIRLSFLLLVGLSLFISSSRQTSRKQFLRRHFQRALKLLSIAMSITLITWFFEPTLTIWFGILHLITFGILFGALVAESFVGSVLLTILSFILGPILLSIEAPHDLLLPFGIVSSDFASFDYFPLFPWIGYVFAGIALGHILHRFHVLKQPKKWPALKPLAWMGRNALLIYLVHQPILFAALWPLTF